MKNLLKRPVPMWVALTLGAGLVLMTLYSAWQASYFATLEVLVERSEMAPLMYQAPILGSYELCAAHWSYWPRVILFGKGNACPGTSGYPGVRVHP